MSPIWRSVDRWGPGVIALATLLCLAAALWVSGERTARLEGMVEERVQLEIALRSEVQVWQAHVVALRERMIREGVEDIPPAPRPIVVEQVGKRTNITTKER